MNIRWVLVGCLILIPSSAFAGELKILLPLQRNVYQTNERIDLAVIRSAREGLPAGDLELTLQGTDGGKLTFTFPVKKAEAGRATEHLHFNGWLLRPGKYQVQVSGQGASAQTDIEIFSHIRKSSFRLINWGRAKGKDQLGQGEDNLGYNMFYGHYGQDEEGNFIRAGVDFMANCTMGGGHQMDLRQECDWSDPLVIRGGTRRVVKRAFIDRTRPNVPGVHFYDEPGLTWHKDPRTGKDTPQAIPSQMASYEAAFGHPLKDYLKIDPKDPRDLALWRHWARWKLGFMDAAWKDSQFGVRQVRPDFLSVTQSQYGWSAFTDGYYFNVVRSLPVISGHGGYHDFGPGYFNPSFFLEFARARDLARPNWYLPTWYGNTTSDQYRLEQYLSFQTNLQGMMSPPDLEPGDPAKSKAAAGIVETNHLMGRLGTIFTTMPVTRPPVAVLYSLSYLIEHQARDRQVSYAHETPHGRNVMFTYLAGKLLQHQFMPVVEEEVLDGTVAAQHKAIILTSLDYLAPKVIAALGDFARQGGLVLLTGDCTVKIEGGVRIGVTPAFPEAEKLAALLKAKNYKEAGPLMSMRNALTGARVLADALKSPLEKAGIKPVFISSEPGICATRQSAGDIEYLFAVNATHDPKGDPMLGMQAVTADLAFPADRPIYDAIHGGQLKSELKALQTGHLLGKFRFGPGQMRAFARTSRPIGGIKTGTPILHLDYTQEKSPLRLEISAVLLDDKGRLLTGSVPLHMEVIDPHGAVRYDLYRATDGGTIKLSLPLAINDPAGAWKVQVRELLAHTQDTAGFQLPAVSTCPAVAGATRRAVHIARDVDNVFRFFRVHHKVTIVKGSSDFNSREAERLVKILKPWNVECTIVKAGDANKPRALTEEEVKTWSGLFHTGRGSLKPGDKNDPVQVGFVVQGPVILLGSAEDNPLIKMLQEQRFLPYQPAKGMIPGPGRGLIAWQRDGIGVLQESITLIAHDAQGLAEAVGNLFEMAAGIEPLTPLALPENSGVASAPRKSPSIVKTLKIGWQVVLPDRIAALIVDGKNPAMGTISAYTHALVAAHIKEGKVVKVDQTNIFFLKGLLSGKEKGQTDGPSLALARKKSPAGRLVKFAVSTKNRIAVAYWGGTIAILDEQGNLLAERRLPQDITALAWSGPQLVVGDADGRVMGLESK